MVTRSPESLQHHYDVERQLARRLRESDAEERRVLYTHLYDELFRRVSDHPQLLERRDPSIEARRVESQLRLLLPLLGPDQTCLEVGTGVGSLARRVSPLVGHVFAVDVSERIFDRRNLPDNLTFLLSNGTSIPAPDESVDLAFSDQLMEHLHPDDALVQLREVYRCLKPGGAYVCITPSRLSGPHDVSRFFDSVATGFHLKEYTYEELHPLFASVGFRRFVAWVGYRGRGVRVPVTPLTMLERIVASLPANLGRRIGRFAPVRMALGVKLIAFK